MIIQLAVEEFLSFASKIWIQTEGYILKTGGERDLQFATSANSVIGLVDDPTDILRQR